MSCTEELKSNYAKKLLSNMTTLRQSGWKCDCCLKAGNKIFSVHRIVLSSLSQNMKHMLELEDTAQINLRISEEAAEQFVHFIYNGEATITRNNCRELIEMANRFDSPELRELCSLYLDDITLENCFFVRERRMDEMCCEKISIVNNFIMANLSLVISTSGFRNLTNFDLNDFLMMVDMNIHDIWDVIQTWIKCDIESRKDYISALLSSHVGKFSIGFVIQHILTDPLVKASRNCVRLFECDILSRHSEWRTAITEKTFPFFLKLSEDHVEHSSRIQGMVIAFIVQNFQKLSKTESMKDISPENIKNVFSASEAAAITEQAKWEFLIAWTNHDPFHREKAFPDLFSLINLDSLSGNFIRDVVCNDALVKHSEICTNRVKDVIFRQWQMTRDDTNPEPAKKQQKMSELPSTSSSINHFPFLASLPSKEKDRPKPCTAFSSSSTMRTSFSLVSARYIALYRRDSGRIQGIDLESRETCNISVTKVVPNSFQSICNIGDRIFVVKGTQLKVLSVGADGKKEWSMCKQLRSQPSRSAKMLGFKGCLYIFDEFKRQGVCNFALYDPDTDSWSEDEMIAITGKHFCVCHDHECIYIVGGSRAPRRTLRYNTKLRHAVEMVGDTIHPRVRSAAASFARTIYVLGGSDSDKASKSIEFSIPNFPRADWVSISSKMQSPRWNFSACGYGDKIYAVGGRKKSADAKDTIEVLDRKTPGGWSTFSKISKIEAPFTACIVNMVLKKTGSIDDDELFQSF